MNEKLIVLTMVFLLLSLLYAPTLTQLKANPIPPPGISMYEEYIYVNMTASNETVYAKVHGVYYFSQNELTYLQMHYPLPQNSTNISVRVDGNETIWGYSSNAYQTIIGNFTVISITMSQAPMRFILEVFYEYSIPKFDYNYTFLYAMGSGRYNPHLKSGTTTYISITINFRDFFSPNTYMTGLSNGNWTWNKSAHTISRINETWRIETTKTSKWEPFKDDFLLTFRRGDFYVPKDYPTIQEAIDAAKQGDIIFVLSGTYYEHVMINKTISLVGEDKSKTTICGNNTGRAEETIVSITANSVYMDDFTVCNSYGGLLLSHSNNSTIQNIIISNCEWGIGMNVSSNNTISNCDLTSYDGIIMLGSYNLIFNNTMSVVGNGIMVSKLGYGVLFNSYGNIFSNNKITRSRIEMGLIGLFLNGDCSTVINNTLAYCSVGIKLNGGSNLIINNNVSHAESCGIQICSTNVVSGNLVTDSHIGVGIYYGVGNIIKENILTNNTFSFVLSYCNSNTIYHNYITDNECGFSVSLEKGDKNFIYQNNIINNKKICDIVGVSRGSNKWDDGYPHGGNYWSNYNGTDLHSGRYQNETGSDYIGDTHYRVTDTEVDMYPLMTKYDPATHETIQKYIELRTDFNTLYSNYQKLGGNYSLLLDRLNNLNMSYNELQENYNLLQALYNQLLLKQETILADLNTIRNLMYVITAVSIIFVAAILYLGKKTTQIRKSKT